MKRSPQAKREGAGSQVWGVWAPVLALFLLLEIALDPFFWDIPKLTSWAHDRDYQFLYDVHRIVSLRENANGPRVVAFGSSVSASFDPGQVQGLLEAAEPSAGATVHRLLMAGMKPSDYRLFFAAGGESVRPDVAVAVLNLVDFLKPGFEGAANRDVRTVLPPWKTLGQRWREIPTLSEKLSLAFAGMSHVYRYRTLMQASAEDHVNLLWRWLRRPAAENAYGVYPDGHTKPRFGVPLRGETDGEFHYYVDPVWIRQQGRVEMRFWLDDELFAERVEREGGWKKIAFPHPGRRDGMLHVEADSAWVRRAAELGNDVRLLGVRLRTVPAGAVVNAAPPVRYPPLYGREFNPLLRVGDAVGEQFVERWERRLAEETPFGRRFRAYQKEKLSVRDRPFVPEGEHAALEQLVAGLARRGTAVVLVNSPESPLIRKLFENSAYYEGHIRFLQDLADRYDGVRFCNLADRLPAEEFNDWHHVNYIGRIKLGSVYTEYVRQSLSELGRKHG